jgi:hypothetical protein
MSQAIMKSRDDRDKVGSWLAARVRAVRADLWFWQSDVMIFVFEIWAPGFTGCLK